MRASSTAELVFDDLKVRKESLDETSTVVITYGNLSMNTGSSK